MNDVEIKWADGEYRFKLALGEIRELQNKTGGGPVELLRRLTTGAWRVDDVRETVRIGLIGGGMAPQKAMALVNRYVDERPFGEAVPVAIGVLMVALFGDEEAQAEGEATRRRTTGQTEDSPSPLSTGSVQ